MPRRIQQVQPIRLTVLGRITHCDRMRLDRDAALPFEIHRIQQLILLFPLGDRAGGLEQTVRKRRLAVIDVSNNSKIPSQKSSHAEGALYRRRTENPEAKRERG